MPQVTIPNGEIMGSPGPVGSPGVYCFADSGDPNVRPDPQSLLANCSIGSTYQRTDGPDPTHCLYVKTAQPPAGGPTGTWSNK